MSTPPRTRARRLLRRALAFLTLAALGALVSLGWHWKATLPLEAIAVTGNAHADADAIRELAAVPDSARLFDLDPVILADRVQRHPWVAEARVTRWMTGTLEIAVRERVPAALALDGAGRPSHYLDAAGFAMPFVKGAAYDVPLLHGALPAMHPTQPIEDAALLELLGVLAKADPAEDALVSSVERRRDGTFVLVTAPAPGVGAIPVTLGRGGFAEKLGRLRAFWDQAVLTRPDTPIRRIDLRFDGQVVTEES